MLKKVTPMAAAAPFAPGVIERHQKSRLGRGQRALVLLRWVAFALVMALCLLPWLAVLVQWGV